jgi:hypothetical protein
MKEKIETESVRLEKDMLSRVRPHAKSKRMTISGFISIEINKIMDRIDKRKESK